MKVLISSGSKETGALLRSYLDDRGVNRSNDSVVCYGQSGTHEHVLNENCNLDKIKRMEIMNQAGVRTVPWFKAYKHPDEIRYPLLARQAWGQGGTDIVPVFQKQDLEWREYAGYEWFSEYVPVHAEYRVWVFRYEHLDTYEKVMKRPEDYKFIGRNFRNGFDFELSGFHTKTFSKAYRAIESLGLDFGAVDLLVGLDGKVYVLEVNTAPGVLKSGAQKTLGKLADCIVDWEKNDYLTI